MPGGGQLLLVHAVLGAQVGGQRVVRGELFYHGPRGRPGKPLAMVDVDQLIEFFPGRVLQVVAFPGDQRLLGVALAGHRHVLAHGHCGGAGQQAGHPGEHDGVQVGGVGGRDADGDARPGYHAVVGAQHRGPQPVQLGAEAAKPDGLAEPDDLPGLLLGVRGDFLHDELRAVGVGCVL